MWYVVKGKNIGYTIEQKSSNIQISSNEFTVQIQQTKVFEIYIHTIIYRHIDIYINSMKINIQLYRFYYILCMSNQTNKINEEKPCTAI